MDDKAYADALKRELDHCDFRVKELEAFADGVVAPATLEEAKAAAEAVKKEMGRIEKHAPARTRSKKKD